MLDVKSVRRMALATLASEFGKRAGTFFNSGAIFLPTDDPEFFVAISTDCFRKYDFPLLDVFIGLHWTHYESIFLQMSIDRGLESKYIRKWSSPVFVLGLRRFSESWPNGGEYIETEKMLEAGLGKVVGILGSEALPFVENLASATGIFSFLDPDDRYHPGTWRPTLEFVVRDRRFGRENACMKVHEQIATTDFAKYQRDWLTSKYCSGLHDGDI